MREMGLRAQSQQIFFREQLDWHFFSFIFHWKMKRAPHHILRRFNWRHSVNGSSWTQLSLICPKIPSFKSGIHMEASLTFRNKLIRKQRCSYANCCLSFIFLLSDVLFWRFGCHEDGACYLALTTQLLSVGQAMAPPQGRPTTSEQATLCLYLDA